MSKPDTVLKFADSERLPAPSTVTRPAAFGVALTDGATVAAENIPENDPFENPPAGTADCASTNPNPTRLLVSGKKAVFLYKRKSTLGGLLLSPYQPLIETRPRSAFTTE